MWLWLCWGRGGSMGIPTGKALNTISPPPSNTLYIIKMCLEALEDRTKIIESWVYASKLRSVWGPNILFFPPRSCQENQIRDTTPLKKRRKKIQDQLKSSSETLMGEMKSGVMHTVEECWCSAARKEEPPFCIDSDINAHYVQIGGGWLLMKPTAAQTNWIICLNIISTCGHIRMWILNPNPSF